MLFLLRSFYCYYNISKFIPNPIICSQINLSLIPTLNASIIIDGKKKDLDGSIIDKITVSVADSIFINKLDLMNYSKVRIIREKILGY